MKRKAVFIFYDKDGIVDDYVPYFLDKLKECVTDIAIVCNGIITDEGRKKLEPFSSLFVVRDNEGYDGGAYRDMLLNHIGRKALEEYDELLLVNDTFFGPFYDMKKMFKEMDSRKLDFWGITRHPVYGMADGSMGAEHLQSYFLMVGKKLLHSDDFFDYWQEMQGGTDFESAVANFEVKFTDYFNRKGYKWDSYVDSRKYDNPENHVANFNHNYYKSYNLIKDEGLPFLKKKDFIFDYEGLDNVPNGLRYVRDNGLYDTRMIWKAVLRRFVLSRLYRNLQLNAVLSEVSEKSQEASYKDAVVIVYVAHMLYLSEITEYIDRIPAGLDVHIITPDKRVEDYFKKKDISCCYVKSDNQIAIIDEFESFSKGKEYVCFLHDLDYDAKNEWRVAKDQAFRVLWENCLASAGFIDNVLGEFKKDESLGVLTSPFLMNEQYWLNGKDWRQPYDRIKVVAEAWGIKSQFEQWMPTPFSASTFWCRKECWCDLINKLRVEVATPACTSVREKNDMIEILFPYMAQDLGYYTMTLRSQHMADVDIVSLEKRTVQVADDDYRQISGLQEQINSLQAQLAEKQNEINSIQNKVINGYAVNNATIYSNVVLNQLKSFITFNDSIYIYGTGIVAKRLLGLINNYGVTKIKGFIVSSKQDGNDTFEGSEVKTLDEITDTRVGIIVALNEKNTKEVVPNLIDRGFFNLYCYTALTDYDVKKAVRLKENEIYEKQIQDYQFTLAQRDIDVQFRTDLIAEKDKAMDEKDKTIVERDNRILELGQKVQTFEDENFRLKLELEAAPFEYGGEHPIVKSSEELLDKLINDHCTMSRYGDGEFELMDGNARPWFQSPDDKLAKKLKEVFESQDDRHLIAVADILGNLSAYKEDDKNNIRHYLKNGKRQELLARLGTTRTYYDAYVSRPYLMYQDAGHGKRIFDLFKKLWQNQNVLLVEGQHSHCGVGNDLFDTAKSLRRIICPSKNAFDCYDEIMDSVRANASKDDLILISLGPTATVMAYDLSKEGYWALDLGQLDMEYEWCKMGATTRVEIPGKAVPEIEGAHEASACKDKEYLKQIVSTIGEK